MLLCAALGLSNHMAQAQTLPSAALTFEKAHASLCLSCHTERSLRTTSQEAFAQKLRAFQANPIKDQVMYQMAKGLSQAQILELAHYFSSAKGDRDE